MCTWHVHIKKAINVLCQNLEHVTSDTVIIIIIIRPIFNECY